MATFRKIQNKLDLTLVLQAEKEVFIDEAAFKEVTGELIGEGSPVDDAGNKFAKVFVEDSNIDECLEMFPNNMYSEC